MFITRKKFRRKDGIRTFYYIVENVKIDGKHKIRTVKYLGSAQSVLEKVKLAEEYEKMKSSIES